MRTDFADFRPPIAKVINCRLPPSRTHPYTGGELNSPPSPLPRLRRSGVPPPPNNGTACCTQVGVPGGSGVVTSPPRTGGSIPLTSIT